MEKVDTLKHSPPTLVRHYSKEIIDVALLSALNGIPAAKSNTNEKDPSIEEVLLPTTGFTSIVYCEESIPRIYWCDARDGTLGSFVPATGKIKTLLRNLSEPCKISLRGRNLFFVESGAFNSRVCCLDRGSLRLHILWEGDRLVRGLYVTPSLDVYFIRKQLISTGGRGEEDISQCQVCFLPGINVEASLPGANPGLKAYMKILLTRSRTRSGLPRDLAVGLDGHLLLAIEDKTQEGGYIEVYSRTKAEADAPFITDGMRVWRWLSFVMDLTTTDDGDVIYAGSGAPPNSHPTAIGFSRALGMGRFRCAKSGYASCVSVDSEGNIYYCPGINKKGGDSLHVLWGGANHAAKEVEKIAASASNHKLNLKVRPVEAFEISKLNPRQAFISMSRKLSSTMNIPSMDMLAAIKKADGVEEKHINLQVVLRCRPLFDSEKDAGAKNILNCSTREVLVLPYNNYQSPKSYLFNHVLNSETNQSTVFEKYIAPVLAYSLNGYNCTVFAYGQTGTGKTYTLEGDMEEGSEDAGIIPRSIHLIFDLISTMMPKESKISVSHLEIYNEELFDLLEDKKSSNGSNAPSSPKSKGIKSPVLKVLKDLKSMSAKNSPRGGTPRKREPLQIVKDPDGKGVVVKGLEEIEVFNPADIFSILETSTKKRATFETMMNKNSSRSHGIFTIIIKTKCKIPNEEGFVTKVGKINLVDLSGSENIERSGSIGERFREASNINQGLLVLGRVISGLVKGDSYIPYRDSKLTRILEQSLGGNSITTMILTVSPNSFDAEETVSTLNYACLAKKIVNKPAQNAIKEADERKLLELKKKAETKYDGEITTESVVPWSSQIRIRKIKRKMHINDFINIQASPRLCHIPSTEWVSISFFNLDKSIGQLALIALGEIFNYYLETVDGLFDIDSNDLNIRLSGTGVEALWVALSFAKKEIETDGLQSSTIENTVKSNARDPTKEPHYQIKEGVLTKKRFFEFAAALANFKSHIIAEFLHRHSFNMNLGKVEQIRVNYKHENKDKLNTVSKRPKTANENLQRVNLNNNDNVLKSTPKIDLKVRPASATTKKKDKNGGIFKELKPLKVYLLEPSISSIWNWVLLPVNAKPVKIMFTPPKQIKPKVVRTKLKSPKTQKPLSLEDEDGEEEDDVITLDEETPLLRSLQNRNSFYIDPALSNSSTNTNNEPTKKTSYRDVFKGPKLNLKLIEDGGAADTWAGRLVNNNTKETNKLSQTQIVKSKIERPRAVPSRKTYDPNPEFHTPRDVGKCQWCGILKDRGLHTPSYCQRD